MTNSKKSPVPAKPAATAKARVVSAAKPATPSKVAAAPNKPSAAELQLKAYENAVRLFSAGKLAEALLSFQQATSGPASHVADKARTYAEVCRRRTAHIELRFESVEDHFNYGVSRLNVRDVEVARKHFSRALSMDPRADHVLYTLALCCGLDGDGDGACANLKRAIDIDPRNRILARQDPEFLALAAQIPGIRALLSPEYAF